MLNAVFIFIAKVLQDESFSVTVGEPGYAAIGFSQRSGYRSVGQVVHNILWQAEQRPSEIKADFFR